MLYILAVIAVILGVIAIILMEISKDIKKIANKK